MPKIRNTKDKLNNLMDVLVANSERTNKSIESISEQISSLSDLLVVERTLSAKQYRKESILKQRSLKLETANKAFQDELDEIKSKRREIQSEINSILEEERRIQKQERKAEQEKSTYYRRTAKSEFESGNLISGLFLSFLGRNEKTAEEIQEENKQADKEERDLRKKNLIDELTALKEERKQLRNDIKRAFSDGFKPLEHLSQRPSITTESMEDILYKERDIEKTDKYLPHLLDITSKVEDIDKRIFEVHKTLLSIDNKLDSQISPGIIDSLIPNILNKALPSAATFLTGSVGLGLLTLAGTSILTKLNVDLYTKQRKDEEEKLKDIQKEVQDEKITTEIAAKKIAEITVPSKITEGTLVSPDIPINTTILNQKDAEYEAKKMTLAKGDVSAKMKYGDTLKTPTKVIEEWVNADKELIKKEKDFDVKAKIQKRIDYNEAVLSGRTDRTSQPSKLITKPTNIPAPQIGLNIPNITELNTIDSTMAFLGSTLGGGLTLGTPALAATTPYMKSPIVPAPDISVPVSQTPVQSIQQSSKNITERLRSKLGVSIPAEALTGQALTETRGGKSTIGKFNFLNVTATPEQIKSGKYVMRKVEERLTPEQIQKYNKTEPWREIQFADKTLIDKKYGKGSYDEAEAQGKKWVKMNQAFASYDSMKEYEDAAVELFSRERYAKPLQSLAGSEITPKIFGETVGKAGFATADPKRYGETISSTASQLPNKIDSGQKTYIASITNKDLNTPMNSGATVIAPQTNIVTNNTQTANKNVREKPQEPNNTAFSYIVNALTFGFRS